jgi:hypothetical protein
MEHLSSVMSNVLPYDPGLLPTRPGPKPGQTLLLEVRGLPPVKTARQSIRNQKHPQYPSFVRLRKVAAISMAGRAWYFGPVGLRLTLFGPSRIERWSLNDYLGGVTDTLDGSSGQTFTYLPIVFQDDSQICEAQARWVKGPEHSYRIEITFK